MTLTKMTDVFLFLFESLNKQHITCIYKKKCYLCVVCMCVFGWMGGWKGAGSFFSSPLCPPAFSPPPPPRPHLQPNPHLHPMCFFCCCCCCFDDSCSLDIVSGHNVGQNITTRNIDESYWRHCLLWAFWNIQDGGSDGCWNIKLLK